MRAVVFHQQHDIRVEDVPEPQPVTGAQVLLEPLWCGICGTDLHEYTAGPIVTATRPHPLTGVTIPQTLGHEFSASVLEVGPEVRSVAAGDRVAIMPLIYCGRCDMCRRGANHLCRVMACTGLSAPTGGLAERALVEEYQVARLTDDVTDIQGAVVEPAAVALYGVERSRMRAGDRVLVMGCGPIGALAALAASALGAGDIFIAEPNPRRADFATTLGVGEVLTAVGDDLVGVIQDRTGGAGVDVAIECAGKEAALNAAIEAVRPQGKIVQTGLHTRPASTFPAQWSAKDITIEATWCYAVTDWPRVIRLIARGRYPVERIVTARLPLDEVIVGGFDRLIDPAGEQVKVLGSARPGGNGQ
ncbi:MAG TPA: alcohol dehydrogenase catalytic domain-containing protein [Chloroflexota bacterium]|nr:alcohol dehydrogenase catalytic domain-containing protein [Chloroflexota bacterium]